MEANKVFGGQGAKGQETDKLNIDSIIARLLEGKMEILNSELMPFLRPFFEFFGQFDQTTFSKWSERNFVIENPPKKSGSSKNGFFDRCRIMKFEAEIPKV